MINWRDGKAGFVGAAKRLIKGVFSYQHSVTSVTVDAPDIAVGFLSMIQTRGIGLLSSITLTGQGLLSPTNDSEGLLSMIQTRGVGLSSPITDTGQGLSTEL